MSVETRLGVVENAPEAQCLLAPRFSVGERISLFVAESRRDGARKLFILEQNNPHAAYRNSVRQST